MLPLVASLAITLVAFLIFRSLVMWYWRIDRIVALLENIDDTLNTLVETMDSKNLPKA
jgi:hypothetical protein